MLKTCNICGKKLPITTEYFHRDKSKKDGFTSGCKICLRERQRLYWKKHKEKWNERRNERLQAPNNKERIANRKRTALWRKQNPEKVRYTQIKRRAKVDNIAFEITLEEFIENFYDKKCKYCGRSSNHGIDRVDNDEGYKLKNCVPCCYYCNTIKRNKSIAELKEHLLKMIKNL